MRKRVFTSVIFFILVLKCNSFAQSFNLTNYSDENGLKSNLTKACVQDIDGFIWVATDAGIARFDGRQFIALSEGFPSLYIKDIAVGPDGLLYVITDLGIGYLKWNGQKYKYINLINSYSVASDTALHYPKKLYFDKNNILWISDQDGVIKYKNKKFRKYSFEEIYRSDSIMRSFCFLEDDEGNFFVFSWRGYFFYLDKRADRFVKMPFKPSSAQYNINQVQYLGNRKILAAASDGLIEISYGSNLSEVDSRNLVGLSGVSSFVQDKTGDYYIGTWADGLYYWKPEENKLISNPFFKNILVNQLFVDRENSIWVCTDEGVKLVQKQTFAKANYEEDLGRSGSAYIINLISNSSGEVFFTDQENIYRVNESGKNLSYERIHNSFGKRVYSFAVYGNRLFVSYRTGELVIISSNKKNIIQQNKLGGRLVFLCLDSTGQLFAYEETNKKIVTVRNDLSIKTYDVSKFAGNSQLLKASKGNIFFITFGDKLNILKYNNSEDGFIPYKIKANSRLNTSTVIYDFLEDNNGSMLAATNYGLYKVVGDELIPVIADVITKAIYIDKNNTLWLGSEQGVIAKVKDEVIHFKKQDGLPTASIIDEGIVSDGKGRIWVATSNGLAYWQLESHEFNITPKPALIYNKVDDKPIDLFNDAIKISDRSTIEFEFASLSFPDRIEYQTRLLGISDEWSEPSTSNKISFHHLQDGTYTLQIRARQAGHLWSEIKEVKFYVVPPWFRTGWMYIIYFVLLVAIIHYFVSFVMKKRIILLEEKKKELENTVAEKTNDLREKQKMTENLLAETEKANMNLTRANEELRKANKLKSDLLSIAAHDLKNPLSSIIGFSEMMKEDLPLNSSEYGMAKLIHDSSIIMLKLITDILDSAVVESTNLKLKIETVDIAEIVERLVIENSHSAEKKLQEIIFTTDKDYEVEADPRWIREAIDNLISNAIKYSPKNKKIYISIVGHQKSLQIRVKDEGPGLTADDMKNLFAKFQRLSARPTGGESSTGLGLSIVKEIVSLHYGKVWAESEYGNGSTFIIELPAKPISAFVIQH